MADRAYRSPAAFRRALTDRLRDMAKTSRWSLSQLQRQIAYDRLLERLYLADADWIVKGATALLARDLGVRGTVDIDVYRHAGDWFRFDIGPGRAVRGDGGGVRLPATAFVGATEWCSFHVDLVGSEIRMTGEPEQAPPLARVSMPDIEQRGYRVYPLVDHIADKVAAILQRYGPALVPSTRFKDLVDLVAIALQATVEAEPQRAALESEADRRGITLPATFAVPDREIWTKGYAAEAKRSRLDTAFTLNEALAIVAPFLNPLLDGTASGHWDPKDRQWVA